MSSTYSSLKIELIGTGEQAGFWGSTTNTNLGTALEEAIVGRADVAFATDADLTLTLTDSNSTQIDRDWETVSQSRSRRVWGFIPTASLLTSVDLRWGSDSSNYYHKTVTQTQQGTAFVNGWNLCQFQWSSATTVGTPVTTAIDYARVTLNVTGTETACLVNGLDSILGTILSYEYYSKYLFRDASTGAYQETVTDDSNLINLDTESFNLLEYQVLYQATQQQQGLDASFYDGGFAKQNYDAGVLRYKSMYKSELQKPQSQYYQLPYKGYNRTPGS